MFTLIVCFVLAAIVAAVVMRKMGCRSDGGSIAREQQRRRAWADGQRDAMADQR